VPLVVAQLVTRTSLLHARIANSYDPRRPPAVLLPTSLGRSPHTHKSRNAPTLQLDGLLPAADGALEQTSVGSMRGRASAAVPGAQPEAGPCQQRGRQFLRRQRLLDLPGIGDVAAAAVPAVQVSALRAPDVLGALAASVGWAKVGSSGRWGGRQSHRARVSTARDKGEWRRAGRVRGARHHTGGPAKRRAVASCPPHAAPPTAPNARRARRCPQGGAAMPVLQHYAA
jgi:hypothetical protein